jgi:2-iminobutanoate/2-iminopropanoate deaminase
MEKVICEVPVLSEAIRQQDVPLSPVVRAADFVFVSGLPPVDLETGELFSGDIARQTELSLANVKSALEAAGSSLDKVVKVTIYITNSAHFKTVNDVYRGFFPHDPPARSFVAMSSWPIPFDIEIECIALA